ncbi:focadhesin isoform X2 [Helicoverpa armigera]|uniref:focadhesin isoform X2 n=1 Tax=Helicoverpa armigera TaxID=29058 RepID=UPI003082C60B
MDEIEYKLNTKNSVLIVNAIDKLLATIKSKYKPIERQRFVNENEELKFLREKCSSTDATVSMTACQGLLALVELGVLEIAHTMSTVVTLLPSTHNYSAIISTMSGLLILDLKARLVPGQQYKCQFSLKSPQHLFITVLEKNKAAEDVILAQMHSLCTHPDYIVSSNSLELLRPVFLWLTCHPKRESSIKPWQLLLGLPQSTAQSSLIFACLSCQQISNEALIDRSFAAYTAVTEAALYRQNRDHVVALLPMLARVSNQLMKLCRDPRPCYVLLERCFALDAPELRSVAGITLMLLAENLSETSALYLLDLLNLALNIISKYEYSAISLNVFVAQALQWLNLPSYLTAAALKVGSKILTTYKHHYKDDRRLYSPNLKANKTFQALLYSDSRLSIVFKANQNWERIRDDPDKLKSWLESLSSINDDVKLQLLPFFMGMIMEKRKEEWYEEIILIVLKILVDLVQNNKDFTVQMLPLLVYLIANERNPAVKLQCFKALPLMAKSKENVPDIVKVLQKIKSNKGAPTSLLILIYTSLAETQVRCFPYLQEMLVDQNIGRPDDLKWELDIAKALSVQRICEIRPSSHGLELVSVIASLLNRCTDRSGAVVTVACVESLARLWRCAALAPHSTWAALQPKLAKDHRPTVQISICQLLSEVPSLRVATPEFDNLISEAVRKLWSVVAEGSLPEVVEAGCDALATYKIDDYKLADVPEIYRRTVKLPASYCKTPADAARRPEEVLDYVPCEIWPEVFKYTNLSALGGVSRLAARLIEREVRGYRSGQYALERHEPASLQHLHPTSVARGLVDCFRRQATSPSYDFPDTVLLAILQALTSEFPKPLPPFDLCFLPEVFHRGLEWRRGCVTLAARQAQVSPSGRRILETYLQGVSSGSAEESDTILVFDILPILCRSMPPNSLRPPIEKSLSDSFAAVSSFKLKGRGDEKEHLFIQQIEKIRQCLECDKIHDANRTLLSQIVEQYFSMISDDNVAWPSFVLCCRSLSSKYLERMTSPSGWWSVSAPLLRKASAVRCAVAALPETSNALNWLNEIIDAQASQITEQEYSLRCMVPALKAVEPDAEATREWFLQLMGRTQVAFNETEDKSAKLYLCDVFMLCVVVFSGLWALESEEQLCGSRSARQALLPPAAAELLTRSTWANCTLQMLEWLCHTRTAAGDSSTALACQRALLAARHAAPFATHNIWMRLESHFGRDIIIDE